MNAAKHEAVERLERAGQALHTVAALLAEVRRRHTVRDDLTPRLDAIEEEARTLSGEMAMRLRDLDEAAHYAAGGPT